MKCCQQEKPNAARAGTAARTILIAAVGAVVGVTATWAQQPAGGGHDGHGAGGGHVKGVREHYTMVQGAQGPAAAKEAMLKMAAHQYLLGEAAADPELKKLAATPELRKVLDEVRTTLKDHAALDAKKAELLKDHDEMLMILAHALLMQDAETMRMLKDAEAGKANH